MSSDVSASLCVQIGFLVKPAPFFRYDGEFIGGTYRFYGYVKVG